MEPCVGQLDIEQRYERQVIGLRQKTHLCHEKTVMKKLCALNSIKYWHELKALNPSLTNAFLAENKLSTPVPPSQGG